MSKSRDRKGSTSSQEQTVPTHLQLVDMNFSGNLIPSNWYRHLRHENGKPNLNAIINLGEIVYWYRPVEIRDEQTGEFRGWRKKYKADKLQRSYQSFADQFGLTKRQVKDAIRFLEEKGIVTKEFRTIHTDSGMALSNVLFLDLNVQRLREITYDDPMTLERHTPYAETSYLSPQNVTPMTSQGETYTENTTEITTTDSSKPTETEQSHQHPGSGPDAAAVSILSSQISQGPMREPHLSRIAAQIDAAQAQRWVDFLNSEGLGPGFMVQEMKAGKIEPPPRRRGAPVDPRVDDAWAQVIQRVQSYGRVHPPEFDDPLIVPAIREAGGWAAVCEAPDKHERAFMAAYTGARDGQDTAAS